MSKTLIPYREIRLYLFLRSAPNRTGVRRYLLLDHDGKPLKNEAAFYNMANAPDTKQLIEEMSIELKKAQEEITELKMLVAIYEETLPSLQEASSRVLL